jgi:2,4-dienoyl-CoA reductase-like NADH-dependent reductase (Old Yellow Enzyme family)
MSVHSDHAVLFQPLEIGGLALSSRIVMPPMLTLMGLDSEQAAAYYEERARGGVGLIILEGTGVERLRSAEFVAALRGLAERLHRYGAAVLIQLFRGDRSPTGDRFAPSAAGDAREATTDEVLDSIQDFGAAAAAARGAGLDGAEVHGAHGFFLNQFFSPLTNKRSDEFGGAREGRMQFGLRAVRAMRAAAGDGFLIAYRHTPAQFDPGGYSLADTRAFAPRLANAGADVIDISPSTSPDSPTHADLAAAVKAAVGVPVIAVGGMDDPDVAAAALRDGACDLVAIGRGLIADPEWPAKVRDDRLDGIIVCTKCDEKCFGHLRQGLPIECTENPRTGHEYELPG